MAVNELEIQVRAETDQAQQALSSFRHRLASLGNDFSAVGDTLTRVGQSIVSSFVGIGSNILTTAGNFESALNQVSAVTGAQGVEFDALREKAKELGSTTAFSASEAAHAISFLGMAGLETADILNSMDATLALAAAGSLDLASTADIASNILGGFQLEASQMARVADVLAQTARSSNTDIRQLGEAFSYAAPVAEAFGATIEEASALIGKLGDIGIQGSRAGTTLAAAMTALLNATPKAEAALAGLGIAVQNNDGSMRSFAAILNDFASSGATAADVFTVFGQEAGRGMLSLINGIKAGNVDIQQMTSSLQGASGAAQEMANIQMQGFQGQMKTLQSAMEGLIIAIGETGLLEFVTQTVAQMTKVVQHLATLNPTILQTIVVIGSITAAVGGLLIPLGMLVSTIGTAITATSAISVAAPAVAAGVVAAATAIKVGVIGVASAVAAGALAFAPFIAGAAAVVVGLGSLIYAVVQVRQRIIQMGGIVAVWSSIWSRIRAVLATTVSAIRSGVQAAVSAVRSGVASALSVVSGLAGTFRSAGARLISAFAAGIRGAVSRVTSAVSHVASAARRFLPFSDAKTGPLSDLTRSGYMLPATMAKGVAMGSPLVADSLSRALQNPTLTPAIYPRSQEGRVENITSHKPINVTINLNGNNSDVVEQLREQGVEIAHLIEQAITRHNRTNYTIAT